MTANDCVREYWNVRAQNYDEYYNSILARQELLAVSNYFINGLRRRYDICVDLGCGTGRLTEALALVSNKVLAVDISEAMLGVGKKRLAGHDFESRVEWVQKDVLAFLKGREANSVDICAAGLLTHQMNPVTKTAFMAECHRVLKNTGDLFLTEQVVCDETIQVPQDPAERRRVLYEHIVDGFYRETGAPVTFRDDFEHTDTATQLFERLRQGGFTDVAFYSISPILAIIAAKKRSLVYVAAGFPALKAVPVGNADINPVRSAEICLPGSLVNRFEILSEEPGNDARRILARYPSSGQKVMIDIARESSECSIALAKQKEMAELLAENGVACAQPLEYAVEDDIRVLVVEQPDGVACDPDVIGRLSLYESLQLMRSLLKMCQEIAQLGVRHTAIPDGVVLKDRSRPVISDLRRLQRAGTSPMASAEQAASLRNIGQLLADALVRHTNRFVDDAGGVPERDLLTAAHSLPTKLVDLLRNLATTPPRLSAAAAIDAVERFLAFRANRGDLSIDSSIRVNREFISILEFETMPPAAWASVWERCKADQRLRDLLYAVFERYVSVYSNSNLFGILVTHDYEEFLKYSQRQLAKLRIRYAVLEGISFRGWRIDESEIKDCRFRNCDFSEAVFRHVQFVNCDFSGCSFAQVSGEGSYLIASQFYECNLSNAVFSHANFERSKIVGCVLRHASLEGSNFHSATVTGSFGIDSCNLENVNAFNVDDDPAWRKAIAMVTSYKLQTYKDFEDTYSKIYGNRFDFSYAWLKRVAK